MQQLRVRSWKLRLRNGTKFVILAYRSSGLSVYVARGWEDTRLSVLGAKLQLLATAKVGEGLVTYETSVEGEGCYARVGGTEYL
jgi:hypothetical protein